MSKTVTTRVRCAVSGIVTGCRPDVYAKRVAKAGSEQALADTYVSSFAKRELRAGKTISQIRANLPEAARNALPSEESLQMVVEGLMAKKAKASKSASNGTSNGLESLAGGHGTTVAKNWQKTKGIDADVANFVAAK